MKKYYVFYNKENKKYEIKKANIIKESEDVFLISEGGKIIAKDKKHLFESKEYAEIVKKEMATTKAVKNKFKGKYYVCPICGKRIRRNEITVDHKIPKKYFQELAREKYNVDDIRLVEDLWKQCWNYNNLQLICEDCNKKKGANPYMLERYIAKKSYMSKKYEALNRGSRKIHIRNGNFISRDLEMDILKRYGNTFDKKYII